MKKDDSNTGKTVKKAKPAVSAEKKAVAGKAAVKKTSVVSDEKASKVKKTASEKAPRAAAPKTKKTAKVEAKEETAHKKLKLSKAQRTFFVDLLMELRAEYMEQLRFHQEDALASKKDSAGERPGMATHMADLGTDNFRHEVELGLLSDEGDVVEMIDEALQRIHDSEFGICLDCGCEINMERLEAKPYARYCTKCKSAREDMDNPYRSHR